MVLGSLRSYYGDAEDNVDSKLNLYFTYESRNTLKSFSLFITVKAIAKLNLGHRNKFEIEFYKISRRSSRSSDNAELIISRCCFAEDGKEMYSYNAPLFCSLNLLFSDVPVAVAVVVMLNSLIMKHDDSCRNKVLQL